MHFTENISNKLSELITRELNYNDDKKEIITYAIETALLFVLGSFCLILLGYSLNALMPTVIAAFFGSSLRRVSGGAHFDTPLKCLAFGTIVYSFLGVSTKKVVEYDLTNRQILIFLLLISLLTVVFLAPVDSESKPIKSTSFKYRLKIFSILFVIISFLVVALVDSELVIVSAVLGVVYQSITLLPVFNK
ncbi:accessory gene regulator ArgB-like protein [Desulfosporosinus shakirovi]|uniref:accessory gene regulator ArgB-like protein n=1 Tax=Desulfosporosinus shakirovi TaxID=2885154 RepID=UPI001E512339|nr:accessory gene regulator B family protein [Desulfosporosinus sp. SRJS8]MCB8818282.1 accessory gene regulator B family protein [Desulfosporosinus sp. SRJS8]